MNERKMKIKLRNLVIFSIAIFLLLIVLGSGVANIISNSFEAETIESMEKEAENYKIRIEKQIDNNFQLLSTLAGFIEVSHTEDRNVFEEALEKADSKNDFLMFGFFNKRGYGTLSLHKDQQNIDLASMQPEVQDVCRLNFKGEKSVSEAFIGDVSSETVFVYGVPVYRDGHIIGSLVASDSVDAFSEEVGDKTRIQGSGLVSLIDAKGDFIIRGDETVIKTASKNILGFPYMDEENAEKIKSNMAEGIESEFKFKYRGEDFDALLTPMNINGSYLLCINSPLNVNHNTFVIAYASGFFFLIVMLIIFGLSYYGYREMKLGYMNLKHIAYDDELTGINNFRYFEEYCSGLCDEEIPFTIVSVNIRQFKFINEVFGAVKADKLLVHIANILKNSIYEGECVCRESADFFYLVLLDTDKKLVRERLNKINENIINTTHSEDGGYRFSIYGGASVSRKGAGHQKILTEAMFAMARTRIDHNNQDWFFDEQIYEKDRMDNYVENFSEEALKKEEFKVYLQPKVCLNEECICGAEALVRWVRDDGTIISPGDFIPLFEKNGFCVNLDMYMFDKVCAIIRGWIDKGYEPVRVSVNQSRHTFYKETYIEELSEIIKKYDIPASLITLEILEGTVIKDIDEMNHRLEKLRKIGFIISMDDFGTGYSSLNTLGRLKIDELKLDRSFLREAAQQENKNARLIMEEIISLSKKLSISTVVEGVETKEDDEFIKKINCDCGQGFLYGKPIKADIFTDIFLNK